MVQFAIKISAGFELKSLAVAPTCRKAPSHSFVIVSPTLKLSSRFFRDKTRKSLPPSFKVLLGLASREDFYRPYKDYWVKNEKTRVGGAWGGGGGGGCSLWRQSL